MGSTSSSAAVFAGLLGKDAVLVAIGGKVVLLGGGEASPLALVALGCFGGAVISGVAAVIALGMARRGRSLDARDEGPEMGGTGSLSSPMGAAAWTDYSHDSQDGADTSRAAYSKLPPIPKMRPSRAISEHHMAAQGAKAPSEAEQQAKPGPRHMRIAAQAPAERPQQTVVAPSAHTQQAPIPAPSARPKHAAADAQADVRKEQGSHATSDYGQIAENYVRKQSLRERMAARAAGVANVLSHRLGHDMFDDLPVIERADGTVGDVGTSWWDSALSSSMRQGSLADEHAAIRFADHATHDPAETTASLALRGPRPVKAAGDVAMPAQPQTGVTATLSPMDRAAARQRALIIAQSVAEIDTGVFPAHRDASELDQGDLWDVALKAMGERIATQHQSMPVFFDEVGGSDTIDEPSGLEGSTSFIPFKKPAGHPEVVDTDSYVDYLIEEEFSQNSSKSVRRTSRDYLKVIKGGSQKSRPIRVSQAKRAYAPKHMRPTHDQPLAKEA